MLRDPDSGFHTGHARRILIDARKICDGGVGRYTRNLIHGLLHWSNVRLGLLGDPVHIEQALSSMSGFETARVTIFDVRSPQYSLDEQYFFSRRIPQDRFDLYHVPHYPMPRGLRIPAVLTVHDLIHLSHPEKTYYPFVASTLLRRSIRAASAVITVSDSVAAELSAFSPKRYGLDSKLHVVPNTLAGKLERLRSAADPDQASPSRFAPKAPYLLAIISQLKPHKGVDFLLNAFEHVTRDFPDSRLLLAGQACSAMVDSAEVLGVAARLKQVRLIGEVSDDELFALYRGAKAVVIPSTAEGFGLPVLEAHAGGAPVIIRPVPALMELKLPGDFCATDFSLESYCAELAKALTCEDKGCDAASRRRSEFLADCALQLQRFAPAPVTAAVLRVYENVLTRGHSTGRATASQLEMR
jgi:glycosyltransferase involved in cell wall biosynthesis